MSSRNSNELSSWMRQYSLEVEEELNGDSCNSSSASSTTGPSEEIVFQQHQDDDDNRTCISSIGVDVLERETTLHPHPVELAMLSADIPATTVATGDGATTTTTTTEVSSLAAAAAQHQASSDAANTDEAIANSSSATRQQGRPTHYHHDKDIKAKKNTQRLAFFQRTLGAKGRISFPSATASAEDAVDFFFDENENDCLDGDLLNSDILHSSAVTTPPSQQRENAVVFSDNTDDDCTDHQKQQQQQQQGVTCHHHHHHHADENKNTAEETQLRRQPGAFAMRPIFEDTDDDELSLSLPSPPQQQRPETTTTNDTTNEGNELLVRANLVLNTDDDGGGPCQSSSAAAGETLQRAYPMPQHDTTTIVDRAKAVLLRHQCLWLVSSTVLIIIMLLSAFLTTRVVTVLQTEDDTTNNLGGDISPPPHAPSSFPSTVALSLSLPQSDHRDELLDWFPNSTLTILQDPFSPQSQAYNWVLKHEELPGMPPWRKQQLFALATFFYSFGGPHWPDFVQSDWMDDSRHECFWFSFTTTAIVDDKTYVHFDATPCNDQGQLEKLTLQGLQVSTIDAIIPPEIQLLSGLRELSLVFCDIEGAFTKVVPTELFQMTSIRSFNVPGNMLTGSIPSEIGQWTQLTSLILDQNALSGTPPNELWSQLSHLETLSLASNQFDGLIPSHLSKMSKLVNLQLEQNHFSGPILTYLASSHMTATKTLRRVSMSSNQLLSGSIPTELGLQTNIFIFEASNNAFSGVIVSELGLLNTLYVLSLSSNNNITGTIPTELGALEELRTLELSNLPALKGTIPSELGQLVSHYKMRKVNMSHCGGLSGTVPESLCSLQNENCTFQLFSWMPAEPCSVALDCSASLPCGLANDSSTSLLCGCGNCTCNQNT